MIRRELYIFGSGFLILPRKDWKGWMLNDNGVHTTSNNMHYTYMMIYSFEGNQFQWTEIGDEGATALADLRVIKNFTTLK